MSFTIGGIDLILATPRETFDPRSILDVVLDYWPEGVFQDVDEQATHPLTAVVSSTTELKSREFFVYRDKASAESWDTEGRTADNGSGMVHFLIRDDTARPDSLQVTMVVDALTGEMAELYSSLSSLLESPPATGSEQRKGFRHLTFDAELREAGWTSGRIQFYELVDKARQALFPDWSRDELACHPHDALQFCEIVRAKARAPLPDKMIMRALLNYRKRGHR